MENSLIRTASQLTKSSSLDDFMRETETVFLLIDTSGSMNGPIDPREPKRRIDGLREVVAEIKGTGHVPMIAFGGPWDGEVRFVDAVPEPAGGTPLHAAIPYAKQYGATRLVIVSDGMPDLKSQSLDAARQFGGRIDIVYVGDVKDGEGGLAFLESLAKLAGGTHHVGSLGDVKLLSRTVIGLLGGDVAEQKPVISGPGFTAEPSENFEEVDEEEKDDDDDDSEDDDSEDDDDHEDED